MTEESTEDKKEKEPKVISEGCTCDEEFVTTPCPVHQPEPEAVETRYGEDVMIITDAHLYVKEPYGSYEGFKFVCPDCKVPSIMVNPDMARVCTRCGKKVLVKSKTVTDFVRKLNAK